MVEAEVNESRLMFKSLDPVEGSSIPAVAVCFILTIDNDCDLHIGKSYFGGHGLVQYCRQVSPYSLAMSLVRPRNQKPK